MPPPLDGLSHKERLRRAALCVKDALHHRSPMMHELSAFQVQVFTLLESKTVQFVTYSWIFVAMGLIFWEPVSSREDVSTDQRTLVVLEFLFLAWVALLIIGRIAVYRWAFLHKPWNWLLVAVWFLTFVDACSFAAASGNVVRFARPLRAMFILSFAPQLRRMTASILVTLVRTADVLLFVLVLMVIWGYVGNQIFNDTDMGYGDDLKEGDFESIQDSLLSLFVLLTSENYPWIMYPMMHDNKWSFIFFFTFVVLGLFLLMNSLVAVIYDAYKDKMKANIEDRMVRQWLSLAFAFHYLDTEDTGLLGRDKWMALIASLELGLKPRAVRFYYDLMDSDDNQAVDMAEFLELGELLLFQIKVRADSELKMTWWQRVTCNYCACCGGSGRTPGRDAARSFVEWIPFRGFILFAIVLNTFMLMLHSRRIDGPDDKDENSVSYFVMESAFLLLFTIEICAKIYAYRCSVFLQDNWNKMDLFLVAIGVLMQIIQAAALFKTVGNYIIPLRAFRIARLMRFVRVGRVVRVVRLFTHTHGLRILIATLFRVMPILFNLMLVMLVLMYLYAAVGMELFAGRYHIAYELGYDNEFGHFDEFGYAMLVLFQILTGNDWHTIMYAGMAATPGMATSWYFTSFYTLALLIGLNLVIGSILDIYTTLKEDLNQTLRIDTNRARSQVGDSSGTPSPSEKGGVKRIEVKRRRRQWQMAMFQNEIMSMRRAQLESLGIPPADDPSVDIGTDEDMKQREEAEQLLLDGKLSDDEDSSGSRARSGRSSDDDEAKQPIVLRPVRRWPVLTRGLLDKAKAIPPIPEEEATSGGSGADEGEELELASVEPPLSSQQSEVEPPVEVSEVKVSPEPPSADSGSVTMVDEAQDGGLGSVAAAAASDGASAAGSVEGPEEKAYDPMDLSGAEAFTNSTGSQSGWSPTRAGTLPVTAAAGPEEPPKTQRISSQPAAESPKNPALSLRMVARLAGWRSRNRSVDQTATEDMDSSSSRRGNNGDGNQSTSPIQLPRLISAAGILPRAPTLDPDPMEAAAAMPQGLVEAALQAAEDDSDEEDVEMGEQDHRGAESESESKKPTFASMARRVVKNNVLMSALRKGRREDEKEEGPVKPHRQVPSSRAMSLRSRPALFKMPRAIIPQAPESFTHHLAPLLHQMLHDSMSRARLNIHRVRRQEYERREEERQRRRARRRARRALRRRRRRMSQVRISIDVESQVGEGGDDPGAVLLDPSDRKLSDVPIAEPILDSDILGPDDDDDDGDELESSSDDDSAKEMDEGEIVADDDVALLLTAKPVVKVPLTAEAAREKQRQAERQKATIIELHQRILREQSEHVDADKLRSREERQEIRRRSRSNSRLHASDVLVPRLSSSVIRTLDNTHLNAPGPLSEGPQVLIPVLPDVPDGYRD